MCDSKSVLVLHPHRLGPLSVPNDVNRSTIEQLLSICWTSALPRHDDSIHTATDAVESEHSANKSCPAVSSPWSIPEDIAFLHLDLACHVWLFKRLVRSRIVIVKQKRNHN